MRISINGFGRIGKCVLRALFEYNYSAIEICQINTTMKADTLIHGIKYDSVHGKFPGFVSVINDNTISINDHVISLIRERDIRDIKWNDIDIVMECTGSFTSIEDAGLHLNSGAKRVLISAPSKSRDVPTVVYGVNDNILTGAHKIISLGSCTTNCLAPVAKVINDMVGIKDGFVTTVHAYTNDQNVLDGNHRDARRSRSCAMSIIPTSTGAAKSIGLVIPELSGKLDGSAVRVPVPNVSMIDFVFNANRLISAEDLNNAIRSNSFGKISSVLTCCDEPLVSIDFMHTTYSSIVDCLETRVVGDNLGRLVSWYDNEWAFAVRMLDVAMLF